MPDAQWQPVACSSLRGLLVRASEAFGAVAAMRGNTRRMRMAGRRMKGCWLAGREVPDPEIGFWIDQAPEINAALPAK